MNVIGYGNLLGRGLCRANMTIKRVANLDDVLRRADYHFAAHQTHARDQDLINAKSFPLMKTGCRHRQLRPRRTRRSHRRHRRRAQIRPARRLRRRRARPGAADRRSPAARVCRMSSSRRTSARAPTRASQRQASCAVENLTSSSPAKSPSRRSIPKCRGKR